MKPKFFLATFIALSLLIAACGASAPTGETPTPAVTRSMGVMAQGRLQPQTYVDLPFSLGGSVAEVLVKEGDSVEAGQPLARLTPSAELAPNLARAQQELLAAQQALAKLNDSGPVALAQAELAALTAQQQVVAAQNRIADLKQAQKAAPTDKRLSDLDLAQAEAQQQLAEVQATQAQTTLTDLKANQGLDPDQVAATQARLTAAQAVLESVQAAQLALTLTAPQAGVVASLSLKANERVAPGVPVITLADLNTWVVLTDDLTELEVVNVQLGQTVELTFDALPELKLSGVVQSLRPRYEEKRGDITYTITILVNQPSPYLRWGLTTAVRFTP